MACPYLHSTGVDNKKKENLKRLRHAMAPQGATKLSLIFSWLDPLNDHFQKKFAEVFIFVLYISA